MFFCFFLFITDFNFFTKFRDEKILDALLLKLTAFLLCDSSNDKIITKILQIFQNLSEKLIFANKFYKILFNTESLIKKTKQLMKIFDDTNLNCENLLQSYFKLLKFSNEKISYFSFLCKFFINVFNVSFKNKNNIH
jgi:hypothetical protein